MALAIPDKGAMRLGAIILAGGRSARMGRAKESLPFRGDTLLGHAAHTLAACCERVVVVARDAAQTLPPLPAGVARTHDAVAGRGPLAGLLAGLRWLARDGAFAPGDAAFVTACDHPFLSGAVVRELADRLGPHDAVVPRADGALQPLCAVYRLAVAAACEALLATDDASPRALAAAVTTLVLDAEHLRGVDPELRFLRDVDTPADYDEARLRRDDG